ncbi:MAG: DUF1566 domain-containing protein [Nitrospinales bacterium]
MAASKWTKMYRYPPTGDIAAGDFTGDGKTDVASSWKSGLWYQNGATLGWTKVWKTAPYTVTAGNVLDVAKNPPNFSPIPKTGQTISYAPGDDGDLQMGVPWPDPRFTDNGDGTVTDNLTGLIWLKNANCFGGQNWKEAIDASNNLANGQCGLSDGSVPGDWRLPNFRELYSVIDFSISPIPLPPGHPFTGVQVDSYWSSTTSADDSGDAWIVGFYRGYAVPEPKDVPDFLVWSVRGGALVFEDVPSGYWAEDAIYKIYDAGITTGCSKDPLMYCPENPVNRDQMAVFLGRATHDSNFTPPDATGIFADVPKWYWAADWIEQFYVDGLTKGCKTDPHDAQSPVVYYCPKYPVTRTTMAIFLLRAKHGKNYIPPKATGIFEDVWVNYWAADWIEQLYREGITTGCKKNPLMYCPSKHVTRSQMAVFLARILGL